MTAIRVRRQQDYGSPLDDGFRLITDVAAWPSFWPGLVRVEPGSRWSVPGDRTRLVMKLLGRQFLLELTLRKLLPSSLVVYDSVQEGLPAARHERHFRPVDDGFSYEIVVEYQPRAGLTGVFDRSVVRRATDRAVRRTLRNLEPLLGRPARAGEPAGRPDI